MRRRLILPLLLLLSPVVLAQTPAAKPAKPAPTLRSILLEQLRSTHTKAEWFVPVNTAVADLTPEQAKWVPPEAEGKSGEHSVGQLANHLVYWNERALTQLRGEKPAAFDGNNDETFNTFDAASWAATVKRLDAVMTGLEDWVKHANRAKLNAAASTIAHIGTHNAYHTGQILYVRKLQGSWNPANGVK
jgi:uncharacterized damage-inducible protein DinB